MTLIPALRSGHAAFLLSFLLTAAICTPSRANPALEGCANDAQFKQRVARLAKSKLVKLDTLTKTAGGRSVIVLTIGTGSYNEKPAILLVGNVDAAHVAGSELALRTAEQIVAGYPKDKATKALLDRVTLYVIPRPTPDATAKNFAKPYREQRGNAKRTDDDRDFETGEDPFDDLNRDGWITMMRVEDSTGEYMPHPQDPRVMIKADPKKNEVGRYRLLTEGRDDDGDEKFNEDAADGVDFNRNFTHKYPAFKKSAGQNAVSEAETRAVADFAFDHPNIAAVFTFTPEDNLMHPWQPNPAAEKARIKTTLLADDAPFQNFVAGKYRKLHGGKDAPKSPAGAGSFSEWAYFHYGRWSFAARGWWVPKTAAKKKPVAKEAAEEKPKKEDAGEARPAEAGDKEKAVADAKKPPAPRAEKRGADDVNVLKWLASQKIDGFVEWKPIKHPDFPNNKVEVGGFKAFYRLNPPASQLDPLAKKHAAFLAELAKLLPKLQLEKPKVESLGAGVYRITTSVSNQGYLPTVSKMGERSRHHQRLQIELTLPDGAKLVQGVARRDVPRLAKHKKHETVWLIQLDDKKDSTVTVRVWSPAAGEARQIVELK